jgi:hypothetical protein
MLDAGGLVGCTEVILTVKALWAGEASAPLPANANALVDVEVPHVASHGDHSTDDLVTRNQGI